VNRLLQAEAGEVETSRAIVTLNLNERTIQAEMKRLLGGNGTPTTLAIMLYPEEKVTPPTQTVVPLVQELRTPLTSISGYTELLLNEAVGILGEMQRQFLQRVRANTERMSKLLEDLLQVTVLDSGNLSLSPEPVSIVPVIENAIMSLSAEFRERDLTVELDMPTELPPVQADRDSLHQIVLNLLSNACRCSRQGSQVLVRASPQTSGDSSGDVPDYLLVSVTDAGGGVSPEDQARVFHRVYRADNPLVAGLGETGVGLSIAKALVEAQGGRIWMESEPSVGCTFSFILPLPKDSGNGQHGVGVPDSGGLREPAGEH
jgi:signal transduction histidine kinase